MPRTIEQQIHATYRSLRVGAAAIAIVFPILLYVGGKAAGFDLRDSMSAYYWANPAQKCPCVDPAGTCLKKADRANTGNNEQPKVALAGTMRNWFVGFLFTIGVILYVNKGHSDSENIALNIAGILAWGIAVFPMPWDCQKHLWSVHGSCAIGFFLAIAWVAAFCPRNTLILIKNLKVRARYQRLYTAFAIVMALSPLIALVFNSVTALDSYAFFAEFFGIYAFAGYWIVKTIEMSGPDIEKLTMERIPH